MNTRKLTLADWVSIVSIVFSVAGAALALCRIAIPGIVLAVIGCVAGIAVKFCGKKWNANERIANAAFIVGIVAAVMAIFGLIVANVIDGIFAGAQI